MSVRLRVAAIILDGDRVFLVSTRKGAPGYFVPPGGTWEEGETVREALAREVEEEAGLRVEVLHLLAYRELWRAGRQALELFFSARLPANNQPTQGVHREGRDFKWVSVRDLSGVPHFPERLAELCGIVLAGQPGVLDLGVVRF